MARFIKDAIKRPGALTRKAKAAGAGIAEFAREHMMEGGMTGQQSRFYMKVLAPIARRRKGKKEKA